MIGCSQLCNRILQWNLNGLQPRLAHLQSLILGEKPKILVLQETKMKDNENIYLKDFDKIYRYDRVNINRGGGVCIAVHESIPAVQLNIISDFEMVACTVFFQDISINICNVYFTDAANVNDISLSNLINSIPSPKIVLGDMNAKHLAWGSQRSDPRGNIIYNVFSNKNLTILNDGSPTYFQARTNIKSHLDITACSSNLTHKLTWNVYPNKHTSDHYPILIDYNVTDLYTTKTAKWKFDNANWKMYKNIINLPDQDQFNDPNTANQLVVNSIIEPALATIPRT